jgi:hypothetical protein
VEHYQAILATVLAEPLQRISDLPQFKLTESFASVGAERT